MCVIDSYTRTILFRANCVSASVFNSVAKLYFLVKIMPQLKSISTDRDLWHRYQRATKQRNISQYYGVSILKQLPLFSCWVCVLSMCVCKLWVCLEIHGPTRWSEVLRKYLFMHNLKPIIFWTLISYLLVSWIELMMVIVFLRCSVIVNYKHWWFWWRMVWMRVCSVARRPTKEKWFALWFD